MPEAAVEPVVDRTVKQLVCEGACNQGQPKSFDDAVKVAQRRRLCDGPQALDPKWIDIARLFKHTPHAFVYGDQFQCLVCGATRRYGRRLFGSRA